MTSDQEGKLGEQELIGSIAQPAPSLDSSKKPSEPRPKVVPIKAPTVVPLRPVRVPPKRKTKGSENQGNVN